MRAGRRTSTGSGVGNIEGTDSEVLKTLASADELARIADVLLELIEGIRKPAGLVEHLRLLRRQLPLAGQHRPELFGGDPPCGIRWYRHISLHGRATQLVDDPDLTDIDRLSVHYTGGPYADRAGARVLAWMDIESWFAWNGGAPWQPACPWRGPPGSAGRATPRSRERADQPPGTVGSPGC
ncbi:MAG: class putative F420-dependent enzyme [Actinoallomurus sp.]|nr:class putative F420-dependent enzyme [Actinoallomurus sp.]